MANQVKVTPDEFAARWGTQLKGSIERIREGIQRVDVAPGKAAAAAADKWQASISSAATKEKWRRRIGAVTLEEWQSAMISKGLIRIASGVDAAQGKMATYGALLIAHQNTLLRELDGMADVTLEDSISRMVHWVRGMAKLEV